MGFQKGLTWEIVCPYYQLFRKAWLILFFFLPLFSSLINLGFPSLDLAYSFSKATLPIMWLFVGHVCDLHSSLNGVALYNSLLSFILLLQEETETYSLSTLHFVS